MDWYHRLTSNGTEFHLDPQAVRKTGRMFSVVVSILLLVPAVTVFAFAAWVGYALVGWWGVLPATIAAIGFVLVIGRLIFRWAASGGRMVMFVKSSGRIMLGGSTLLQPGEGVDIEVERVENRGDEDDEDDGPFVWFRVIVHTAGPRVLMPVPSSRWWDLLTGRVFLPVPSSGWWDLLTEWGWTTSGFDSEEEANRFATAIADASGLPLKGR